MASKCIIVNPWHWLREDGRFLDDPRIRKRSIRVAQCIEYGGPLAIRQARETLITCRFRPGGKSCPGMLCVLKQSDDAILAFCAVCAQDEFLIYEWEDTPWARGPKAPMRVGDLARKEGRPQPQPREPSPENLAERLARVLAVLGSTMSEGEVRARITSGARPPDVVDAVLATLPQPPTRGALERFLFVLMEVSETTPPLFDPGWDSPTQVRRETASDQPDVPKVGRNVPCPCGSGKKYKRWCGTTQPVH